MKQFNHIAMEIYADHKSTDQKRQTSEAEED